MGQIVELKKFSPKENQKYKVLQITDIMLHTAMKRVSSFGKNVRSSFETGEKTRSYSPIVKKEAGKNNFVIDLLQADPEFIKVVREYEDKGYKVLLSLPEGGIPVFAGDDAKEFIESKKGKRILRHLAKIS